MVPAMTPAAARYAVLARPAMMPDLGSTLSTARVFRPYRGVLHFDQAGVEARQLVPLVIEVLHRLVIEQRIDVARVGFGVGLVGGAVVAQAPFGDGEGEGDVARQGGQSDGGEGPDRSA